MTAEPTTPDGGTTRAWLELMRLSNLPTCFSNVLVGTAIGVAAGTEDAASFPWTTFLVVSIAVALLYVGGMALNDVVDVAIDRTRRSGRPIASGRISRRSALVFAIATLAIGSGGLAFAGTPAFAWGVVLAGLIVVYDLVHKRTAASVMLMGACRGLVYVVSAVAVIADVDGLTLGAAAVAMTVYIAAVTAVARREHIAERRSGFAGWAHFALPVVPLLAAFVIPPSHADRAVAVGLLVVLWLVRSSVLLRAQPPRPKDAIMGWLAGICLIDAYTLTLLDQRALAMAAIGLFFVTWLGHRRILGT